MKPSRSGTASPTEGPGAGTIILIVALAIVLAFAGSFIFGLRRNGAPRAVAPDTVATPQSQIVSDKRARVEVYNGAGKPGLAKLATQVLRDAGFDVVQFGNAREIAATSQILDRTGNQNTALEVGRALGISSVKTAIDTTRYVEVTVILGSDWVRRDTAEKALPRR